LRTFVDGLDFGATTKQRLRRPNRSKARRLG
jgi:hypothetical protein